MPSGHIPRKLPVKSKEAYKDIKVAASDTERIAMRAKPYLAAVASVVWYVTMLRPDDALLICRLCTVMHDPSRAAWDAVIDTISYLYHTRDMGITYFADFKDFKLPSTQMVPDLDKCIDRIARAGDAHWG